MANHNKSAKIENRLSPPRVLVYPSNPHGTTHIYRVSAPGDALRRTGYATPLFEYRRMSLDMFKTLSPDMVVEQHPYHDEQLTSLKMYAKAEVPCVIDIDDLFWEMDDSNVNKKDFPKDIKARMAKCMQYAEKVTVSTATLAERVRKDLNIPESKITVLRNQLPQAFVTAAKAAVKAPRTSDKPRIGWTGSISHDGDLAILADVVRRTADRYQWVFMGCVPEGVADIVEFHKFVPFSQFPMKLASLDLDLGVVPLVHTPFNRCKSDLKLLEYAAAGCAVMVSALDPFKERERPSGVWGVDDNNTDTWVAAIDAYFASGHMPEHAEALHSWVRRDAIIETQDHLASWTRAWTPNSQGIFVPGSAQMSNDIAIVGEPVGSPHFETFEQARKEMPSASILYVRRGAVPSDDQVTAMIKRIRPEDEGSETIKTYASVSAMSNDGDYPAPGKFMRLEGHVAERMSYAAAALDDIPAIPVPYSSSPMVLLSSAALSIAGIPDEKRYKWDPETALVEWSFRVNTVIPGKIHIVAPDVFVPVMYPAQRVQSDTKTYLSEIATWHPQFAEEQKKAVEDNLFLEARRNLDLAYAYSSYHAPQAEDYPSWLGMHDAWTPTVQKWADAEKESWPKDPIISIVMPIYNPDPEHFAAAIKSVVAQTYKNWRLIMVDDASTTPGIEEMAREARLVDDRMEYIRRSENGHICKASNDGLKFLFELKEKPDWVMFLDHDDLLAPSALFMLARKAQNDKLKMIFGDNDMISPEGQFHAPDFKPGWDYDLMLAQNYVCHPCMYRLDQVMRIKGFEEGMEGSQDYDLTLRYMDSFCCKSVSEWDAMIGHVPHILYHWRQAPTSVASNAANKPYAFRAAHQAVVNHLNRINVSTFIGSHPQAPLHHIIRYLVADDEPKVSIIILTQTDREQLENCVGSVLKNTLYKNYDIIVRQVGDDPGITSAGDRMAKLDTRVKFVKGGGALVGTFNYALLNNAVANSPLAKDAAVLVFLNDDTTILEGSWLRDMVGTALRDDVGAVGCKLIYPDGRIQHNGIIFDIDAPPGEKAIHAYQGLPHTASGPFGRSVLAHQAIAVTGACMAVKKTTFDSVKGFDALNFPLDYNDVDLCMRLAERKLHNVVLSHILVQHIEGSTKKKRPDIMSRTGVLMSEALLTESVNRLESEVGGAVDKYTNLNMAHEPSGQMLRQDPYRPWKASQPPLTLLIGGDRDDVYKVYAGGELPISAEFDGPYMKLIEPSLPHIGLVDVRDKKQFEDVLMGLGITRITLRRLGKGSIEALGMLRILATQGWSTHYVAADFESVCPLLFCSNSLGACNHEWKNGVDGCQSCVDRDGSGSHGYISVAAYRHNWNMFAAAIKPYQEGGVE